MHKARKATVLWTDIAAEQGLLKHIKRKREEGKGTENV